MAFHLHRLANGLEILGETIPTAISVGVGFYVKTGARDEHGSESGVSHFLEHMVFKGTPRRTALEVNLHFDRIGANYNAYTSEEATVYYAAVLPEYLTEIVDILADIVRPSLRLEDFETEKQVILEEIGMYDDMPTFAASDFARKIYYANHPLGNSILGSKESIVALKRDQMQTYYDRRYGANNIVFAIAGNFDWPSVIAMLEQQCGQWPTGTPGRANLTPAPGVGGVHRQVKATVAQEHLLLISPGPSAQDPLRYAAATLALAIGDDSGSRFYWELVHPGAVESASCGLEQNEGSGSVMSSFSCEPDEAAENYATMLRILAEVQESNITEEELITAKCKIASRLVRASERTMGRMRMLAGSWIDHQEFPDLDRDLARFEALSLASLREVLDTFPLTNLTTIAYGPVEELAPTATV